MATFSLIFLKKAAIEWRSLDGSVRPQIAKKLEKRLANPHVEADRLDGKLAGCYRLKFKKIGIRLVYTVIDDQVEVLVIAVGKRSAGEVYEIAEQRLQEFKGNGERPLG